MKTLDHETAARLREMLGKLQLSVLEDPAMPQESTIRIVTDISDRGFRLIDELEGVVR